MKSLWEFNPGLWIPSFLFHFGLYLSIVAGALLTLAVLPALLVSSPDISMLSSVLVLTSDWLGLAGAGLIIAGATFH